VLVCALKAAGTSWGRWTRGTPEGRGGGTLGDAGVVRLDQPIAHCIVETSKPSKNASRLHDEAKRKATVAAMVTVIHQSYITQAKSKMDFGYYSSPRGGLVENGWLYRLPQGLVENGDTASLRASWRTATTAFLGVVMGKVLGKISASGARRSGRMLGDPFGALHVCPIYGKTMGEGKGRIQEIKGKKCPHGGACRRKT